MRTPLLLDLVAGAASDRPAITSALGAFTFGQLQQAVVNVASVLADRPAGSVGFLGENSPAFPITMYAGALAGRVFCPLNYRLPDDRLHALLRRLAPATVIVDDEMAGRAAGIEGIDLLPRNELLDIARRAPSTEWVAPEDGPDVAVQLFTSGTSGEPKAAVLKHENLTSYVLQTVEFLGADEGEKALVSVPPYHIAGVSGVLTGTYSARHVAQLESFSPEGWVEAVNTHGATHAMVVPTMLGRILDVIEAGAAPLPSLKALAYGGGRMPEPVIRRALIMLPHVAFTNAYGLTETSSTISVLGPDDHEAARRGDAAALRRLSSVGKPVDGIAVEIRDAEGRVVPTNAPGEIWVRGDQVSGEYADRKVKDEQGWFPTKDLGWFDDDGYLYIDGRLDDVIVRGGENISPGEIEDVLREHPAIDDIAVAGAPDVEWGEKVVAFAVLKEGQAATVEELQDWVRSRLRSTKTPQEIHFRADLPYNETGKLLRRVLRDTLVMA